MPRLEDNIGISTAGHKSICVPVPSKADYAVLVQQGHTFRTYLDPLLKRYPELFPAAITCGTGCMGSFPRIRKRQIQGVARGIKAQVDFIANLFEVSA